MDIYFLHTSAVHLVNSIEVRIKRTVAYTVYLLVLKFTILFCCINLTDELTEQIVADFTTEYKPWLKMKCHFTLLSATYHSCYRTVLFSIWSLTFENLMQAWCQRHGTHKLKPMQLRRKNKGKSMMYAL